MKNFNHITFQNNLLTALTDIINNFKDEDICGFSISTDEDVRSITASFNTKKHLLKCWKEDVNEDKEYYKWYPPEWKLEGINNDSLDQLSLELFNLKHSKKDFELNKKAICELLVDTLKKLRIKGLFNSYSDNFVLVFNITDSDNLEDDLRWLKELNDKKSYSEYENWTKKW